MFGRKAQKPPYGWISYRQNLLVLYEDLEERDDRIDALIDKTEYRGKAGRPSFAEQWADVNQIELRLFRLIDDTRLLAETERKFIEAEEMGLEGRAALRKRFDEAGREPAGAEERRAIAITLLEEMFVKYSYRFAEREKRGEVSGRLTRLGLLIIGLPTALVFFGPLIEEVPSLFSRPDADSYSFAPRPLENVYSSLSWASSKFGAFFVVMYFGIVGAYFSRLFGYAKKMEKLRWADMDLVYAPGALWVRLLVGAIAAVILFFLMMGNILSGPIFLEGDFSLWQVPDAAGGGAGAPQPLLPLRPTEDFARLVVWCTLAGFSERFVPDRFAELEESARGSGNKPAD
ncbi:hypothetical protein [Rhodovulum marinum]|uniref:Uncharacterized protein n=1 Tax=Rhodovulum marinum TaxID=320662 RepID=A0A4R2PWJ7_9RHOB|nr:hypothetical protein [Rhodovulum marinum]TCP40513.1 hypothetical protein EV662_107124 [Rhodovulum marinum]